MKAAAAAARHPAVEAAAVVLIALQKAATLNQVSCSPSTPHIPR